MNNFIRIVGRGKVCLLLVFPLFYFIVGAYFRSLLGDSSLRSVDPEYIYFISGLGISEGHLKIGHIDNPGTPLQYLVALVFRITYLFRQGNISYLEDIFTHPDLYLSVVNLTITTLVVFTMFIAGKYVYRKTGAILYALLIQTLPFLPIIWYDIIGRITPELLFPLPLFALSMFMVKHLYEEKSEIKVYDTAILGFILAFGLSLKLTFISLWIIPLILIRPWKMKLFSLGFSIMFFFVIALPVTLQIEIFWNWIKDLFLHSGTYGEGEKNIVNLSAFKTNLAEIIQLEKHFFVFYLLLLLILTSYLIYFRKRIKGQKIIVVVITILTTILVQLLIIGKHYSHHYFIPALMLLPLVILLSAELLKKFFSYKIILIGLNVGLIIFLFWNITRQFGYIHIKSEVIGNQIQARQKTWHVVSSLEKNSIKIIVSQDYGSPFKEYALLYSTAWAANNLKPHYAEQLAKLYQNTYQYTTWDDKFQYWGSNFDVLKIIETNTPVYIYLEKNSEELYTRSINKINPENKFVVNRKEVFLNPDNNEIVYQLYFQKLIQTDNKMVD